MRGGGAFSKSARSEASAARTSRKRARRHVAIHGDVGERRRIEAGLAVRHRHRHRVPRETGEGTEEAGRVLRRQHAADQDQRARIALLDLGEGAGDGGAGGRIVAAVEPDVGARRRELDERARFQPLHARRPVGVDEPGLERARRERDAASRGARRPRGRHSPPDARREVSAAAGRAARPRPDRRAGRARQKPCSPRRGGRASRPRPCASSSIIASACSSCGRDDARRAALQDAGFLGGDAGEVGRRGTPHGRG